jgi:hypothetical protein
MDAVADALQDVGEGRCAIGIGIMVGHEGASLLLSRRARTVPVTCMDELPLQY